MSTLSVPKEESWQRTPIGKSSFRFLSEALAKSMVRNYFYTGTGKEVNQMAKQQRLMCRELLLVVAISLLVCARPASAAEDPWPKRFEDPRGTVVMYQPQLEDYKDDVLTARAAVSVKTKDSQDPNFRGRLALGPCPNRPGHPDVHDL